MESVLRNLSTNGLNCNHIAYLSFLSDIFRSFPKETIMNGDSWVLFITFNDEKFAKTLDHYFLQYLSSMEEEMIMKNMEIFYPGYYNSYFWIYKQIKK
jgi:hypothetical protein